jgi:hypothetical protein
MEARPQNPAMELGPLSGLGGVLDAAGVATILDRGFRGMAKDRAHWQAPVRDRRTKDRLRQAAGVQPLPGRAAGAGEQAIGHLANAWTLRRWRGLLYRVRAVFRAAGALVCLGRWLRRVSA